MGGMLHAGIGETQLNNLLSTMNVHCIDTKSLKAREHEVGQVLENHAKESEHKYLLEEAIGCLNINTENEEGKGITVSTDTCWQKKGSGRAYNSLSDQNKGDVEGMENGLKAIVEHMYGDHAHCNRSWCGFLKDREKYKHSNLPHGKDLRSDSLRTDLEKIFLGNDSVNPRKLASLSSSQANENFNNMLAAKAPKAKHYSSSASLGYRVDSSILQKNEGYAYVSEVHASMGLSPGEETIKRSSKINMKRKKNKEKAKTKEAKRRRFFLKQTRTSKTASKEIREGKTYESEIGFKSEVTDKESEEIPEIQDITKIPLNEQEVIKAPVVIFDLETTGLSRKSDITQLAAYSETLNFSTYIFPSQAISKEASEVTQFFVNDSWS
ncbi:uncharacterized protein LOC127712054 [Mytilus californianus]|uniref:uncharacterized protein LOC127712054 n=1 Tax=Mytilus californianus TaxID=6549 RepID=UPI002245EB49|nr:uncharacterized protein LOC127712054 [Mytilus californianus]